MPGPTSSIPDALDNLITALQARAGLTGVQVREGWESSNLEPEAITIGGDTEDNDDAAVDGDQTPAQLGAQRREETFDIHCEIAVWSGDTDAASMKTVRRRAFTLLGEIEQQLRGPVGDPTLGGAVRYAQLAGPLGLRQGPAYTQAGEVLGLLARIPFTVRAAARI
jgi:hypothetical protein